MTEFKDEEKIESEDGYREGYNIGKRMTRTLEIKFTPLKGKKACPITIKQIGYFRVKDDKK